MYWLNYNDFNMETFFPCADPEGVGLGTVGAGTPGKSQSYRVP